MGVNPTPIMALFLALLKLTLHLGSGGVYSWPWALLASLRLCSLLSGTGGL